MAEAVKSSINTTSATEMPKIFRVGGEEMAPGELKEGDILVVYWKEPAKYKTEASIVRFERFWKDIRVDPSNVVFMSRAEFDQPSISSICHYNYKFSDILEMRFCARGSSASAQVFNKLASLHKENRRLSARIERIQSRLLDLAS